MTSREEDGRFKLLQLRTSSEGKMPTVASSATTVGKNYENINTCLPRDFRDINSNVHLTELGDMDRFSTASAVSYRTLLLDPDNYQVIVGARSEN